MTHVHWQTAIFTSHGLYAHAYISTLCSPLSGKQQRQKFHLSRPISVYGLCLTVSLPMAGRAFLQMDQAKPAHQKILRYFEKRRQNSDMGCRFSLCAGCHTKETPQYPSKSLHNFTNSERFSFRKNAVITTTYRNNLAAGNVGLGKPVEFIHLTVGHY